MLFYQSYGDNNRLKTFDNYKKLSIWSKIILIGIKKFIKKLLTIVRSFYNYLVFCPMTAAPIAPAYCPKGWVTTSLFKAFESS